MWLHFRDYRSFCLIYDSFSFKTALAFLSLLPPVFRTNLPVSNHQDFSSPIATQHSHGVYSSKLPLRLILGILYRHFTPSLPFHNFFSRYAGNIYEQTWLKRVYKDILIHVDYIQVPVPRLPTSLEIHCTWRSKFRKVTLWRQRINHTKATQRVISFTYGLYYRRNISEQKEL
jgi:hypothetical protein